MQLIVITSILLCLAVTATKGTACPNLGTAVQYTFGAGSTITNVGLTVIHGSLFLSPGTSVTGFPPGVITGQRQVATAQAAQAQADATSAYNYCQDLTPTKDLTGTDLGGQTLTPGVYKFASSAGISGTVPLTLHGKGVYVFQIGSTITTAANTKIVLSGGATPECVFWAVGSSATLGATSVFRGIILAKASVTFGTGDKYHGSVYAEAAITIPGAVTVTGKPVCVC